MDPLGNLVVLWTDGLMFLLVAAVVVFALYARHREHLRSSWKQVGQSRLGMAAAAILVAYLMVGLLDSLHFYPRLEETPSEGRVQYSTEVLSLLGRFMMPLRVRLEKTYSAPFAAHLYAKETLFLEDGSRVRSYPRLEYGGAHLDDPSRQRVSDIAHTALIGAAQGLLLGMMLGGLIVIGLAHRHARSFPGMLSDVLRGRTEIRWNVVVLTLGGIVLVAFVAGHLSLDYHILGTDKVGQDVFYQALKSIRTGLVIGTLTTLIMLPFAVFLGITAGYFRGWTDDVVQYLYTTLSSIPGVLLIAASILMIQVYMARHAEAYTTLAVRADLRLLFLCIILGVTSWTSLCRILRGEALKIRELEYIQAATAFGVGHTSIIVRHIVPNVVHVILITVVLDFSALVLAEAVLSYINTGVDPTTPSWGNMINSARLDMGREPVVWWSLVAAFTFMFGLVLAANLFADAVRNAFDPRTRKG
jgi:peptide/nickel transport system permease protein